MIAHFSDLRKIVYIDILRIRRVIVCGFTAATLLRTVSASTENDGKVFRFWVDDDKAPENTSSDKDEE